MSDPLNPFEQLENNEENFLKYKDAGTIATKAMNRLVKLAKPGKSMSELIKLGNETVLEELGKVHTDIKDKGLAFPICLSVNEIVGNYLPGPTEILKEGDLLKIELGVQIDGFPSLICFTTLVTSDTTIKIDDKRANVLKACIEASREVAKIMKPGTLNTEIVKVMEKAAIKYGCTLPISNEPGLIPGVLSCQISRYIIDSHNDDDYKGEFIHRFILSRENSVLDLFMAELPLEENEVYAIDIVMCSGSGKLVKSHETSIYRKNDEKREELKLKASRQVLNSLKGLYPKSIDLKDLNNKIGLKECLNKNVVIAYPVLSEKTGEFVCRIKFTIIVRPKPVLLCGKQADQELTKLS
ncbi:MAG: metallopeptidase family M24 [Barrevirus sp.]|uniref:Metallopeptidase family M24 n=1 Tax=Barrevirus sp. TaxID=2487763 RepID=A0A3G4ZQ20_9VIRU|nr:MAG: metallopeptidase family M24 [Barrevirus sp.]